MVGEDVRCWVRLPAADTQFDSDVADIALHELPEHFDFVERRLRRSGESRYLLADAGRRIAAAVGQICIPPSHFQPAAKTIDGWASRWKEGNHHLTCDPFNRWHLFFLANALDVVDNPFPGVAILCGPGFGIVDPARLVFPSRWQLKRVMELPTWNLPLHHPHILENHRLFFLFVFIAHDIAGVGGGDPQQLVFHVRNELTALDPCQRDLDGLLVFDFVILSLDRNAPATKAGDLAVTV